MALRHTWMQTADAPDFVEHIFALDADDLASLRATEGHRRVVNPASPDRISAVRNWNSAAAVAGGDLLFVIADDLVPPPHWDSTLHNVVGSLHPRAFAFAICVVQMQEDPTHLRHPIVSRRFYARFGLFAPQFTGMYCDDDITIRAFNRAVVLNGTSLILEHRHPFLGPYSWSESQQRMNARAEYDAGRRVFLSNWNRFRRAVRRDYFVPPPGSTAPHLRAAAWRSRLKVLGVASGIERRLRRALLRADGS